MLIHDATCGRKLQCLKVLDWRSCDPDAERRRHYITEAYGTTQRKTRERWAV
jgi:hypothetical protein